jgi:formylglycine-generating enzyme required for sulfatase activity|tara:strand:+ start:920 stop:2458 length:1539 start_codon:yes stop_codon:yes gene_type:complete
MKKLLTLFLTFMLAQGTVFANNLQIGDITYTADTVNFTIEWENSWRVTSGPSNWDAVWVFIKRQNCDGNNNPWTHQTLAATGHTVSGDQIEISLASDNLGIMIHRKNTTPTTVNGTDGGIGIGDIAQASVSLKLTAAVGSDNFKVFGTEVVYIPEGQFYIGDGYTGGNHFGFSDVQGSDQYAPLLITQAVQNAGLGDKTIYQRENKGSSVALPSTFPLGYDSFYVMKYEINQAQYVDFINSLTVGQQLEIMGLLKNSLPPTSITGTVIKSYGNSARIEIVTPGNDTSNFTPAVYGLDSTNNNTFNEANDGFGIPVPLNRRQYLAYIDWTALRPMTEFEYEKASRGPLTPVNGEYAWGTTNISSKNSNPTNYRNNNSAFNTAWDSYLGPIHNVLVRGGIDAVSTSNREQSGATFYGVMEMTGSIHEYTIGGFGGDYSTFTIANGDGSISDTAENDIPNWMSKPYIYKGNGVWDAYGPIRKISNRYGDQVGQLNNNTNQHYDVYTIGGRGVRSW